ncbi:MAG: iron-sulfur cluster-binding domain-containing protein [Corynebacterium variabile]|uniref:flavin reductase family protein n=1 Tax=Corynebacterium variabile TaxID=1727 RepID=UPI002647DA4A|nr:iron-sulfur cluster-binding domain-containing protein [Corynebacterium variabile]MDN6660517.1 iron-sulfur cluster-binding domain-containing protein [Corynebacterium variabile]
MRINNRMAARLGRLAELTEPFTTPLLPTDYAGLFNPLFGREIRGRVTAVDRHDDFTTVTIEPGPGAGRSFTRFQAGQFIGLGLQIDGRWTWRCYSLTNAPELTGDRLHRSERRLTISVKPVPDGTMSTRIADRLRPGRIIRLSAPGGDFHLPDPVPEKILFVTAGAGVTPVMSILRWLDQEARAGGTAGGTFPDVVHVHSERATTPAAPFGDELTALAAEQPGYTLIHRDSATAGRLHAEDIPDLVPDLAERVTLACGPTPLLDDLRTVIPDIRTESFHATDLPGSVDPADLGGEIVLGSTGVTTSSTGTTTILDAAEAAGVPLIHGCRMGICRTCVTAVKDGTAVDLRDGAVYGPGEQIRTCCSVPSGPLAIAVN